MVTTLSSLELTSLFREAGTPGEFEPDMDAFLRSHVALAVPLFLAALLTWNRATDLSWDEARRLEAAWTEGFDLVRRLGHPLKPRMVAMLARMPRVMRTFAMWVFSRSALVKITGAFGPLESRALIDAMTAEDPKRTRHLQRLRP